MNCNQLLANVVVVVAVVVVYVGGCNLTRKKGKFAGKRKAKRQNLHIDEQVGNLLLSFALLALTSILFVLGKERKGKRNIKKEREPLKSQTLEWLSYCVI